MGKRDWQREYEEENRLAPDEIGLLEHVLGDDRPPQGLHRGGFDAREHERQQREAEARIEAEERAVEEYLYPEPYDWGFEYE